MNPFLKNVPLQFRINVNNDIYTIRCIISNDDVDSREFNRPNVKAYRLTLTTAPLPIELQFLDDANLTFLIEESGGQLRGVMADGLLIPYSSEHPLLREIITRLVALSTTRINLPR